MSNFEFELNKKGVAQLLHSSEMAAALMDNAERIADNAGEHFQAKQMPTRVIVVPIDDDGERDNLENNALLKAVRK